MTIEPETQPMPRHLRIRAIIKTAADLYGVDPVLVRKGKFQGRWRKVKGKCVQAKLPAARRQAIVQIITEFPEMSFPHVARVFSLDHTTVMYHATRGGLPPRKASRCTE